MRGPPQKAARAAVWGLRGVLRLRDDALACGNTRNRLRLKARRHHDCLWSARETRHAQHALRRADHHRPTSRREEPLANRSKPARSAPASIADAPTPIAAARAATIGVQKIPFPDHRSSSATGQDARSPSGRRPRGGQPRCARGNPKESPKARTRMTKGKSGANAPDRNRERPPRGRLPEGRPTKTTPATLRNASSPRNPPQPIQARPQNSTPPPFPPIASPPSPVYISSPTYQGRKKEATNPPGRAALHGALRQ